MDVELTGRNEGCEGWTAIKCPPALRAQRFRSAERQFPSRKDSKVGWASGTCRSLRPLPVMRSTMRWLSIWPTCKAAPSLMRKPQA